MRSPNGLDSQINVPARSLWPSVSLDWIQPVWQAVQGLLAFWKREHSEGLYEMLEHDAVLELEDPKGGTARYKKRQRVKFLQNNVIAFQDHVWGDGRTLVDYRVSPGVDVDRYKNGDRWNVLISLRETKNRGDIEEFYIERKILRGFTRDEEWWQLEMQNETRWLKLAIVYPKQRRCQRAVLVERTRNRVTVLDSEHFTDLPDGRQTLTWETRQPKRFETYTIKWSW